MLQKIYKDKLKYNKERAEFFSVMKRDLKITPIDFDIFLHTWLIWDFQVRMLSI